MKSHIQTYISRCLEPLSHKLSQQIEGVSQKLGHSTSAYCGDFLALTRLFTDQLIYVDTRDISVAPHLLMRGEWEMEVTRVWLRLIEIIQPRNILDVGANAGYFGIVAAGSIPSANVHLIEANPRLCQLVRKSLIINGLYGRCNVSQCAVSSTSKQTVKLIVPGEYFGSASVEPSLEGACHGRKDIESMHRIEVETQTLDDLCAEQKYYPELIKIDVESHEEQVLNGASSILAQKRCTILMEYTPRAYSPEFCKLLTNSFSHIYRVAGNVLSPIKSIKELDDTDDFSMLVLANAPLAC